MRRFLSVLLLGSTLSVANPNPTLSKGFHTPHPVIDDTPAFQIGDLLSVEASASHSDLKKVLSYQSTVKNQGERGICSIFSAIGAVEWLFKKENDVSLNLSENYLAYNVFTKINHTGDEGSDTPDDIKAASMSGLIREASWPYEQADWISKDGKAGNKAAIAKTCGALHGMNLKTCLVIHHNPLENEFGDEGDKFQEKYENQYLKHKILYRVSEIKDALNAGQPVVLSVSFFYGAWNHGGMVDVGLGQPNRDLYNKGIVGVPTPKDIEISSKDPEAHSLVVIGYDDVEKVYYFKNSWGTDSWGSESPVQKGFGTMAYGYANKFGTFYQVDLEK